MGPAGQGAQLLAAPYDRCPVLHAGSFKPSLWTRLSRPPKKHALTALPSPRTEIRVKSGGAKDAGSRKPQLANATLQKQNEDMVNGELELDAHRLAQRQKQVDYGKNTLGYERYIQQLPK